MPRFDYAHKWTDEELKKLEEKITKEYLQAAREMHEKAQKALKKYAHERAQRLKALDNTPEARKEYEQWLRSQAADQARLSAMVSQLADSALRANERAAEMARDSLPVIYSENANMAAYEVDRAVMVDTSFSLVDEQTVRELMKNEDEPILREVSVPKVSRAKDYQWNRQKFTSAITQGILQGESIPNIVKRTDSIFGSNKAAAIRAARTATTSAENAGRVSSYERAERLGIPLKQEWMSTLDGRTRDSHRELDGEQVRPGEKFSNGLRYPGDPNGQANEVYNCRCTLIGRVDIEGIEEIRSQNRWSRLPRSVTYEEWKSGSYRTDKKNRETKKSLDEYVEKLANKAIKKAAAHEKAVTAMLVVIAEQNGMHMQGLQYRVKGSGSLQRKIRSDAEEKYGVVNRETLEYAADAVSDVLRYTMIADPSTFGRDVEVAFREIYDNGNSFIKVKNTFAVTNGNYRGLNTNLKTADGYVYELQFHTEESFEAKEEAHKYYEIERVAPEGSAERQAAHDAGARIFIELETPNGAGRINIDTGNPNKPAFSEAVRGIASLDVENELDGGFTVDLRNGRAYKLGESKGYAVGGYGTELIVKKDDYDDEAKLQKIIENYVEENSGALAVGGACLGGWVPSTGEHAGDLFLDVSVVTQSREQAAKQAIRRGEDSITDFENVDWPSTEELAKEYGMIDEYKEARKRRIAERG